MKIKIQLLTKSVVLGIIVFMLAWKLNSSQSVIVKTKLGRVKGSWMQTRLGKTIYAFRGIHYAEPPTGTLRFKVEIFRVSADLTKKY